MGPDTTSTEAELTVSVLDEIPVVEHAVEDALALRQQDFDKGYERAQALLSIKQRVVPGSTLWVSSVTRVPPMK